MFLQYLIYGAILSIAAIIFKTLQALAVATFKASCVPFLFTFSLCRKVFRHRRTLEPMLRAVVVPAQGIKMRGIQSLRNEDSVGQQVLRLRRKDTTKLQVPEYKYHYADFVSLMTLGKSIRRTIQSSLDYSIENIRKIICNDGEKTGCWSCRGQICPVRCSSASWFIHKYEPLTSPELQVPILG